MLSMFPSNDVHFFTRADWDYVWDYVVIERGLLVLTL